MIAAACSGSSTESAEAPAATESSTATEAPAVTETTVEESIETEEIGSLAEELAKAMPVGDEEFLSGAVDSEETALCIATEVVSSVGENKLAELGITPASINSGVDSAFPAASPKPAPSPPGAMPACRAIRQRLTRPASTL